MFLGDLTTLSTHAVKFILMRTSDSMYDFWQAWTNFKNTVSQRKGDRGMDNSSLKLDGKQLVSVVEEESPQEAGCPLCMVRHWVRAGVKGGGASGCAAGIAKKD